jgi:hypothetical protein
VDHSAGLHRDLLLVDCRCSLELRRHVEWLFRCALMLSRLMLSWLRLSWLLLFRLMLSWLRLSWLLLFRLLTPVKLRQRVLLVAIDVRILCILLVGPAMIGWKEKGNYAVSQTKKTIRDK